MFKKAKILFFCMIFVGESSFGQHSAENNEDLTIKDCFITPRLFPVYKGPVKQEVKDPLTAFAAKGMPLRLNPVVPAIIDADFYTRDLGFFCRKELQFEKATKIPLRFRLGTVSYNDYLEGKPNTGVIPNY